LIKIDKMYLNFKFYQIDNFKQESPANKATPAIIFRYSKLKDTIQNEINDLILYFCFLKFKNWTN